METEENLFVSPPVTDAILFDLGGTLIVPDPPVEVRYHRVAQSLLPSRALPDISTVRDRFYTCFRHMGPYPGLLRYGTTEASGFWFWKRLIGMVFPRADDPKLESLTRELYQQFSRAEAWEIQPGAVSLLKRLSTTQWQTGLITNWDRRCRPLLGRLSLGSYFDVVVISSECGAEKPDPALFRYAIERLECPAERIVMVGDDRESDLSPARDLGMKTILLQSREESLDPGHVQVSDWGELGEHIDRLLNDPALDT